MPASLIFFFNDTATTEIYTLSLHDALPICGAPIAIALADMGAILVVDVPQRQRGMLAVAPRKLLGDGRGRLAVGERAGAERLPRPGAQHMPVPGHRQGLRMQAKEPRRRRGRGG